MDQSFYMRVLPASVDLIPYDSKEGKQIFKDALDEGGLEAFFPLSQQFLTQEEPAYCGIGTLCMILNALKIDPAKTWRKPWRWFTQDMLDCCRPLDYVRANGITLSEFTCLARCNGLEANTKYADNISLEDFRRDVIASTSSSTQIMAVSYSRAALGQTGSGHFSPVGGYCSRDGGKVLILDVARFKYPSYWVSLKALYESLRPVDPVTKQPRGYSLLHKPSLTALAEGNRLLRLEFTKATWPGWFSGLVRSVEVTGIETKEDLERAAVKYIMSQPEIQKPMRTRREILAMAEAAVSESAAVAPASATAAAYDPKKTAQSAKEYADALSKFLSRVSATSALHKEIVTAIPPTHVASQDPALTTIFMLVLYSFEPFISKLASLKLRMEIEALVTRELSGDDELKREVRGIRRQMASLETCCKEECGPECGGGSCGARKVKGGVVA
ncbi:Phytochelatin synthase-domain-containing protein [Kalaharituber pfeilii]|nr:Phytochelatin synthase-domain-containing protein [Kalaharituber pfeilii]